MVNSASAPVVGRFAPSPTGPLHAGSLVAALASWLDVRSRGGRWLVRIEDVDTPRCVPGADRVILGQLAALGLLPDAPPRWQSTRGAAYADALARLVAQGDVYRCDCSRRRIAEHWAAQGRDPARFAAAPYPGTCRARSDVDPARPHALRLRCGTPQAPLCIAWTDRRLGPQAQDLTAEVGDIVLRRADGLWAYQLAVVVDDADQRVTDVVRGEDLADNTPRQIHLQRRLGLPTPRYLHTPLVLGPDGHKLSKQNGARAVELRDPLAALRAAGQVLGLAVDAPDAASWRAAAVRAWADAAAPGGRFGHCR
ncbi:tRNA glutamyl-Q(34) synthetase GluQRS [Piscinibacter sakaiensis]|uniref:Glutamyl-Q tRNA(Asp) synthetase n=1 Tax=Piscinibacter sakaiensis TaxID=1547922 RepID=A0A0K8P0R5_PISS1|nr:tRNA glutamyl-Q(34) synthetase GluQRS [Piscinibacter sakaiensis]GAP35760.1 glutamyl-Q-tRNA synthetase [Piscinibacter sakaiensis]